MVLTGEDVTLRLELLSYSQSYYWDAVRMIAEGLLVVDAGYERVN